MAVIGSTPVKPPRFKKTHRSLIIPPSIFTIIQVIVTFAYSSNFVSQLI
jgi:hypothetical protein